MMCGRSPTTTTFLFFVNDRVILNFGPLQSQARVLLAPAGRRRSVSRQRGPTFRLQYVGLTNQQLWDQFGKALSGEVAPAAVYTLPYISGGLIA